MNCNCNNPTINVLASDCCADHFHEVYLQVKKTYPEEFKRALCVMDTMIASATGASADLHAVECKPIEELTHPIENMDKFIDAVLLITSRPSKLSWLPKEGKIIEKPSTRRWLLYRTRKGDWKHMINAANISIVFNTSSALLKGLNQIKNQTTVVGELNTFSTRPTPGKYQSIKVYVIPPHIPIIVEVELHMKTFFNKKFKIDSFNIEEWKDTATAQEKSIVHFLIQKEIRERTLLRISGVDFLSECVVWLESKKMI